MTNEQKPDKPIEISVSENLNLSGKVSAETTIIATVTSASATSTPVSIPYKESTPSSEIVRQSTAANDVQLTPDQFEIVTETVERSKGLGMGFKVNFEFFGIGKLEFEKKPAKETKITTKAIYGDPQKK